MRLPQRAHSGERNVPEGGQEGARSHGHQPPTLREAALAAWVAVPAVCALAEKWVIAECVVRAQIARSDGRGRGYEGCADAELCWQLMTSDGGVFWGRPNTSVSQAQQQCKSGPAPVSVRPNTSVSQVQHQCQSGPTPVSVKPNTSVRAVPTPVSVRPNTSVSQAQHQCQSGPYQAASVAGVSVCCIAA